MIGTYEVYCVGELIADLKGCVIRCPCTMGIFVNDCIDKALGQLHGSWSWSCPNSFMRSLRFPTMYMFSPQ